MASRGKSAAAHAELSESLLEFCRRLPKIELHAHLNGSVRPSTIRELARNVDTVTEEQVQRLTSPDGSFHLATAFQIFDVIHAITTTHEAIARITQEVIDDFEADGCAYIEVRTTPKARPEHGMTKRSYAEAVLAGVERHRAARPAASIAVRLLLSIDRREGAEAAMETAQLAVELRGRGVVGVDLSGNPRVGSFDTWAPALAHARAAGLGVTVHAGEVPNPDEVGAVLDFGPDRLGHMCFLEDGAQHRLWDSRIPVELCLTSNVLTQSVPGYVDHHFRVFYDQAHPVVLCTDDSGIFDTTLSREYALAAATFGMRRAELHALAARAVDMVFAGEDEKARLRAVMQAFAAGQGVAEAVEAQGPAAAPPAPA